MKSINENSEIKEELSYCLGYLNRAYEGNVNVNITSKKKILKELDQIIKYNFSINSKEQLTE